MSHNQSKATNSHPANQSRTSQHSQAGEKVESDYPNADCPPVQGLWGPKTLIRCGESTDHEIGRIAHLFIDRLLPMSCAVVVEAP